MTNTSGQCIACQDMPKTPRVVVVGLASCFGCQLQITNAEAHLMEMLGQIDLRYWQLTSSDPMPEDFDVAVIEGAITTEEAEATVRQVRERAATVITVGACATTAGIPGMAAAGFIERPAQVYEHVPAACGEMIAPRPVQAVIDVDFEVRTCPVDTLDFVDVLQLSLIHIYEQRPIPASPRSVCCEGLRRRARRVYPVLAGRKPSAGARRDGAALSSDRQLPGEAQGLQ